MKKLWSILYIIGLCFVMFLALFLFQMKEEYDDVYLKHSDNLAIMIRDVNSELSNAQLLIQLEEIAEKSHSNLYRIMTTANEITSYNQDIFVKINNPYQFKKTFYFDDHADLSKVFTNTLLRDKFNDYIVTNFKPFSNLKNEGIVGFYYFETSPHNFQQIEQDLTATHFDYQRVPDMDGKSILEYLDTQPKFKPFIASLILFMVIFIFISFYEIFIRFKEIAIRQLLGNKNRQIIFSLLKEKLIKIIILAVVFNMSVLAYDIVLKHGARWLDVLLFSNLLHLIYVIIICLVYSLSLCTIYLVNINLMIKGKKSIKILNIYSYIALFIVSLIVMLLAHFMIWMQHDIKIKLNQFDEYKVVDNYATTLISRNNAISAEQLNLNLKQFTVDKYDDMVLFSVSYYYMTHVHSHVKSVDMGENYPIITTNDNYFKNINRKILNVDNIVHDSQTINIALPRGVHNEDEQSWREYTKQRYHTDKINLIYYTNQPIFLLYNNISQSDYHYHDSNIFVILTKENLIPDNYVTADRYIAWYSQAMMFIQSGKNNYQTLLPDLIHYQLDKNIRSVINVYRYNLKGIYNLQVDFKIYQVSFAIMIFIVLNIIAFMTLTYLEDKKKQHAIYYVQGIPFIYRHSDYLLINIAIILMAYILSVTFYHISWMIGIVYMVVELICLILIIRFYQHTSVIDTLKNG